MNSPPLFDQTGVSGAKYFHDLRRPSVSEGPLLGVQKTTSETGIDVPGTLDIRKLEAKTKDRARAEEIRDLLSRIIHGRCAINRSLGGTWPCRSV